MKRILMIFIAMMIFSSSAFAADASYLLNSVALTPVATGFAPCDQLVRETLGQITDEQMTTYDKVKACYDYLIETCSYGHSNRVYRFYNGYMTEGNVRISEADFSRMQGALNAYDMLRSHVGVCDDYSCAFAALVRAIGLNCYTIAGLTEKAAGGMTGHAWCVINIDGEEYVFDPQIDDNIAKGGEIGYYRFCMTYEELPGSYEPARISDYFKPF